VRFLPVVLELDAAASAGAQPFSFGAEAGMPIGQLLSAGPAGPFAAYVVHTNPYVVGGSAEIRIAPRFSVGVDALLRHWSYDNQGKSDPGFSVFTSRTTANAWEFPLVARRRFRSGKPVSPFAETGAAVDWLQHMRQVTTVSNFLGGSSTSSTSQPPEVQRRTMAGVVAGGGVDVRLRRLHVEPEVRYTCWGWRHFAEPGSALWSNRNQVEVLLGIAF
jgi:hypothetical protein